MSDWQRRETEADLEESRASLQAAMERIAALESERDNLSLGLDKANGRIAALEQIEGNLTRQLAAARDALEAVEWVDTEFPYCPWCLHGSSHADNCQRQRALGLAKKPEETR